MVEIKNSYGNTTNKSKNLRGIIEYLRKCPAKEVVIEREYVSGTLHITFHDYATCTTHFADFSILCDWLIGRRKLQGVNYSAREKDYRGSELIGGGKIDRYDAFLRQNANR